MGRIAPDENETGKLRVFAFGFSAVLVVLVVLVLLLGALVVSQQVIHQPSIDYMVCRDYYRQVAPWQVIEKCGR